MTFSVPNRYRIRTGHFGSDDSVGNCGAFRIPGRKLGTTPLTVIASDSLDDEDRDHKWEHVSVSLPTRCPTWEEMCLVKSLFWSDEDTVVQFHPPKSEYVNNHSFCLHLWRPTGFNLPTPPAWMVGYKSVGRLV
jgi:hypothetical protein